MAIVLNGPCPACRETGHDKTGNHLMIFDDGNALCKRARYHLSGEQYFCSADGENPITSAEITGEIRYTPEQFRELEKEGKLTSPPIRELALDGMKQKDAWEVMDGAERAELRLDWEYDCKYFSDTLKVRNLASRHIRGDIAKLYDVKAGLGEDGKVDRHFYPVHEGGTLTGAIVRELPKKYRRPIGKTWGQIDLFGANTLAKVSRSGRRMDTLLLVGGHCDALAAQQMLLDSQKGTKWDGVLFHVWSVNHGEKSLQELVNFKTELLKFKRILLAFDDDDAGNAFCKDVARLFRNKALKLQMPNGMNDPNMCLMHGRSEEFVSAFYNPVSVFGGGALKSVGDLSAKAKATPEMGMSWPWPSLNWMTFGIRPYTLYVMGAGTGVGKTEATKDIAYHIMEVHGEPVAVIYLEEQPTHTVRSFAGKKIMKRLQDPPVNDPTDGMYEPIRDYTDEEANNAIDYLDDLNLLTIADTGGDKDIDTVMNLIEDIVASGITKIIVDNLTAIEMPNGKGSKVEAIDNAMKRFGTYKDERPITLLLLSHLKRPQDPRVPHEKGGEVYITDFRGSGSITFWANAIFGIERDTTSESSEMQRISTFRCVKSRDNGMAGGKTVRTYMDPIEGKLREREASEVIEKLAEDYSEPQTNVQMVTSEY